MRLKTLFWCFAWALVLAILGLLWGLRSYHVFTQEELVAVVRCEPAPPGSAAGFLLWWTPVSQGNAGSAEKFLMRGDQWMIGGDFLKWHPWLNLLGVGNCHKLTRLNSRYLKAKAEATQSRSVYDLNGGTDLVWSGLYRVSRWLPFVEATYGNAAYIAAEPGTRWGVYATLSGYLIKPLRRSPVH